MTFIQKAVEAELALALEKEFVGGYHSLTPYEQALIDDAEQAYALRGWDFEEEV